MKKIDLSQSIQTLANIGVIAGIIFLAVEIRQNTETQRLSAVQQVLGLSYTNTMAAATDRSLNEAFERIQNGQELEVGQRSQLDNFLRAAVRASWQVFIQRQYGFIDDDIFFAYERGTPTVLRSQPWARDWWERTKNSYPENYRNWIDAIIMEGASD